MRRETPLPLEFIALTGKIHYVVQRGKNEYSSSCPECGGSVHPDGRTLPDRFRMWPVSKYGKPLGWCRHCGYTWTPTNEHKPTREEIELWRQEQIRVETERKQAAERALELLNSEHLWERFAAASTQYSRQVGHTWGIPDSWQDYLKMGFIPDYTVWRGKEINYHSPAVTMPVWWAGDKVQNIKIRVLDPQDANDRYRNWYKTGEHYFYMPLHDVEFSGGGVILVEGEKKAVVAEIYNPTHCRVIGMQSVKPDPELFGQIADCEPVILIPDPDAFAKNPKGENGIDYLVRNVGKERARIVRLPVKLDDGIIQHGLDLAKYIKMAVRP